MSRWKAALIHLCISATIGLIVACMAFGVWYPSPYRHAAGADELMLLLVGVDLVLGPLLTLVVFKSGKKGLRLDLTLIGCAQTAALVYGLHIIVGTRPVFVVGMVDRFELVAANEIAPADRREASKPEFAVLSWTGPKLVGAEMPKSSEDRNRLVFEAAGGKDLQNLPRCFVDYSIVAGAMTKKASTMDELAKTHPTASAAARAWMSKNGVEVADSVWLPMAALKGDLIMIMRKSDGQPLQAFAVDD